jgi:hypothetical protein
MGFASASCCLFISLVHCAFTNCRMVLDVQCLLLSCSLSVFSQIGYTMSLIHCVFTRKKNKNKNVWILTRTRKAATNRIVACFFDYHLAICLFFVFHMLFRICETSLRTALDTGTMGKLPRTLVSLIGHYCGPVSMMKSAKSLLAKQQLRQCAPARFRQWPATMFADGLSVRMHIYRKPF